MKKPKLLIIVHGMGVGGIERYVLRFIGFNRDAFEFSLFCKSGKVGELAASPELIEVKTEAQRVSLTPDQSWYNLWRFLKQNDFDAVVDFTGDFAAPVMLFARILGIQRRFAFYRNEREPYVPTILKRLYSKTLREIVRRNSTTVLSNSFSALNYFFGDQEKRNETLVIYNGVPHQEFRRLTSGQNLQEDFNIPPNSFIIGHVGRFIPQKNHVTLFKVCNILMQKHDNIYLVLCGKDTPSAVSNYSWSPGVQTRIRAFEYISEINLVMNTLDVFLFPSLFEGNPNALIEALLCETPCVISDIASNRECFPSKIYDQYFVTPTDVEGYTRIITQIYERALFPPVAKCREFAIETFNQDSNFSKLADVLTGNRDDR